MRTIWPAKNVKLIYTSQASNTTNVLALVNEVEAKVHSLELAGINRIGLPSVSAFLNPFISGAGLGGVNLKTRHPHSVFVTIDNGTNAVDNPVTASNVFRFLDVPSLDSPHAVNLPELIGPGGHVLVLYQPGDVVAEGVRDNFLALAGSDSIPASAGNRPTQASRRGRRARGSKGGLGPFDRRGHPAIRLLGVRLCPDAAAPRGSRDGSLSAAEGGWVPPRSRPCLRRCTAGWEGTS